MRTSSELVEQREKDQREKDCWIVNGFLISCIFNVIEAEVTDRLLGCYDRNNY